jgi:hypothetical protein
VLRCHAAAFEALGGVPEQILYDRRLHRELRDLVACVTVFSREDLEAGHIVYNRTLLEFAATTATSKGVQAIPGQNDG